MGLCRIIRKYDRKDLLLFRGEWLIVVSFAGMGVIRIEWDFLFIELEFWLLIPDGTWQEELNAST